MAGGGAVVAVALRVLLKLRLGLPADPADRVTGESGVG